MRSMSPLIDRPMVPWRNGLGQHGPLLVIALAVVGSACRNTGEPRFTHKVVIAPSDTQIQIGEVVEFRVTVDDTTLPNASFASVPPRAQVSTSSYVVTVLLSPSEALGIGAGEATYTVTVFDPSLSGLDRSGAPTNLSASASVRVVAPPTTNRPAFVAVSAGTSHTCALGADGSAFCWGEADGGKLGATATTCQGNWPPTYPGNVGEGFCSSVPLKVAGIPPLTSVIAGSNSTCGLSANGDAYCWGGNPFSGGPFPPSLVSGGNVFTSLAVQVGQGAGDRFGPIGSRPDDRVCGTIADGSIYCWTTGAHATTPTILNSVITFNAVGVGTGNGYVACGLSLSGGAYCWGLGILGDGSEARTSDQAAPVQVAGTLEFSRLSVGADHACALTLEGVAYCWGWDSLGDTGTGPTGLMGRPVLVPTAVVTDLRFASISAGMNNTCAVGLDGIAYCWGALGVGVSSFAPTPVPGGHQFATIVSGGGQTCGITVNGEALCWGFNQFGQIGDGLIGGIAYTPDPTPVVGQRAVP